MTIISKLTYLKVVFYLVVMSGKKETRLERAFKPIRINPVTFSAGAVSFPSWLYGLMNINNPLWATAAFLSSFGMGFSGAYIYGCARYLGDRKSLRKYGYDEEWGRRRMGHYCDRQAFYVACVENGFRDEAKGLIKRTPKKEKRWPYFPHI